MRRSRSVDQRRPADGATVIHSDQGTQFTSWTFTQRAVDSGLLPSSMKYGTLHERQRESSYPPPENAGHTRAEMTIRRNWIPGLG
jgi:putative transposase